MLTDLAERGTAEGRLPRRPANSVEESALGASSADPLRVISAYDSKSVPATTFKVYLLRTSTLETRGGGKFEVAWKQTPRGNVKRAEDSTPTFAEMADPGAVFEGGWQQNAFLSQPEIGKALRRRAPMNPHAMFELVNAYTEQLLRIQKQYAEWTGLALLKSTIEQLEARLVAVREARRGCVLPLGWGAGFLSKIAFLDTQDETYRQILRQVGLYSRAIQSGLPFPKTRRIVFLGNQPASIPGFVHLEVTG
jgi:CRISPR-associated protein Csm5